TDIIRLLPTGAALVAFIRYADASSRTDETKHSYLALVAEPGRPPRAVPLGGAEAIDTAIGAWRVKVQADPRLDPSRHAEESYRATARRVRRIIWDPLGLERPWKMVFVVPDGALSFVSLATLPEEDDHYLIESPPAIHYLSAERDLLALPSRRSPSGDLL